MKAKRLKEILRNIDGDTEIYIRNSVNICGDIQDLSQVEVSTYGFFGTSIPCLILNTCSSKELEEEDDEVIDFIK